MVVWRSRALPGRGFAHLEAAGMNHNVYMTISQSAGAYPDRPALVGRDSWLTFKQLNQNVRRRAAFLFDSGVRPGDRVGLVQAPGFTRVQTLLSVMYVGACAAVLGSMTAAADLAAIARAGRLDRVLVDEATGGPSGDFSLCMPSDLPEDYAPAPEMAVLRADQPCLLFPLAGQDHQSGLLMLTHGQLGARLRMLTGSCKPDERLAAPGPGGAADTVRWLGALAAGTTLVLPFDLRPHHLCSVLGVTDIVMAPKWAHGLCKGLEASVRRFPTLRRVSLHAAASEPGLLHQLRRCVFTEPRFVYEWPETGPIAMANPALLEQYPLSVGAAVHGVELQIVDPDGLPMPAGATGLIRLRSPGMAQADDHLTGPLGQHFRGGWFYPGQLGHLEDGGLLFVDGREDQLFFANERWVNPTLIEQVLMTYPGVTEAVAFQSMGPAANRPRLVAAVATETDCLRELLADSRRRLGRWAPVSIIQLADFPAGQDRAATRKLLAHLIT